MSDVPQMYPAHIDPKYRFQRYFTIDCLPKVPKGTCRWCHGPITVRNRRTWCSKECNEEYMVRRGSNEMRHRVERRDKFICVDCGIDCKMMEDSIRWMWDNTEDADFYSWVESTYPGIVSIYEATWHVDHIVPVEQGGGCCGLENLVTRCTPCHKKKTAQEATERAKKRSPQMELAVNHSEIPNS